LMGWVRPCSGSEMREGDLTGNKAYLWVRQGVVGAVVTRRRKAGSHLEIL